MLRGINVGGKNTLPMADLRELLQDIGCEDVSTYIQSGNVVFDSPQKSFDALGKLIRETIRARHQVQVTVFVLSFDEFEIAVRQNPFPDAIATPSTLHLFFIQGPVSAAGLQAIQKVKRPSERFKLVSGVLYLHAPDGIGRSKLAANVEKLLGITTTGRNYRTVIKLLDLARP